MQVKYFFVTFNINCGFARSFCRKTVWTDAKFFDGSVRFGFLKTESEPNFGFPHIPSGAEPWPPKGFPLVSALRMASPDTIILLIVDYHAAVGGQDPRGLPPLRTLSVWTWRSRYQSVSILDLLELKMMEVVVITGAIICTKLQSNRHLQQTNIQLFTGRMLFLSPNQQRQSTEGNIKWSITRKWTLWRCKSTPTPKAKLLWMTSHYGPTVVRSVTEIPFHVFIW